MKSFKRDEDKNFCRVSPFGHSVKKEFQAGLKQIIFAGFSPLGTVYIRNSGGMETRNWGALRGRVK